MSNSEIGLDKVSYESLTNFINPPQNEKRIIITSNTFPDSPYSGVSKIRATTPSYEEYVASAENFDQHYLANQYSSPQSICAIEIVGNAVENGSGIVLPRINETLSYLSITPLVYTVHEPFFGRGNIPYKVKDRIIILISLDAPLSCEMLFNFVYTICARSRLFDLIDGNFNTSSKPSGVFLHPGSPDQGLRYDLAIPLPLSIGSLLTGSTLRNRDISKIKKISTKDFKNIYYSISADKGKGWPRYNSQILAFDRMELKNQETSAEEAFNNMCDNCEAFSKIRIKINNGEILSHDEGFALFEALKFFPGGKEFFVKNVPGWGETEEDLNQLGFSEKVNYMPWSCQTLKAKGLCPIQGDCFSKREKSHNPIKFAYGDRVSIQKIKTSLLEKKRGEL